MDREIAVFDEQHSGTSLPLLGKEDVENMQDHGMIQGGKSFGHVHSQQPGQSKVTSEWGQVAQGFIQLSLKNLQWEGLQELWTPAPLPDCPCGEKTFSNYPGWIVFHSVPTIQAEYCLSFSHTLSGALAMFSLGHPRKSLGDISATRLSSPIHRREKVQSQLQDLQRLLYRRQWIWQCT